MKKRTRGKSRNERWRSEEKKLELNHQKMICLKSAVIKLTAMLCLLKLMIEKCRNKSTQMKGYEQKQHTHVEYNKSFETASHAFDGC